MPRLRSAVSLIEICLLATLTAIGYAGLVRVQRSLFLAGLTSSTPYAVPRDAVNLALVHRDLTEYLLLVGVTLVLYGWVVLRARRWSWPPVLAVLVALPVAVQLVLLTQPPTLSTDAFSYLAHGYLARGGNPYVQQAAALQGTGYGEALRRLGWLPTAAQTPYGPLWTLFERTVVAITGADVRTAVTLVKTPALVGSWGCSLVIFRLARELAPRWRWPALAAWHWSPVAIVECAGEGHLDGLMVLLVLLGLVATVRGRAWSAVLWLGAATLVKFLPAVLGVPVVPFLIRSAVRRRRTTARILLAVSSVAAGAVLAFAPWWVGPQTFLGVSRSGRAQFGWTPSGLIYTAFRRWWPTPTAEAWTQGVLITSILVVAAVAAARADTPRRLLHGCGVVALVSFALLPGGWPWYVMLPIAVLLCCPGARVLVCCAVLTVTTRSIAVFGDLQLLGAVPLADTADLDGLIGVLIPSCLGLLCVLVPERPGSDRSLASRLQ
ncbi:MAG: hypothetical protein ACR2LI_05930 [Propionibacteriaceae bacterium]